MGREQGLSTHREFSRQAQLVKQQANTVASGFAVLIGDKRRQRRVGLQEDTRVAVVGVFDY
jgi:hypothetical protein